jgi:tRNA modification GTPase
LKSILLLINKADKITETATAFIQKQLNSLSDPLKFIFMSAKTGIGVEDLKLELLGLINTGALRNNETIVTNSRHYNSLLKALEEIQKVQYGMDAGFSGDLLAIDIRQALFHFGEITGEITSDDLLGNIFANFCIGK